MMNKLQIQNVKKIENTYLGLKWVNNVLRRMMLQVNSYEWSINSVISKCNYVIYSTPMFDVAEYHKRYFEISFISIKVNDILKYRLSP